MFRYEPLICLYIDHVPDIQEAIKVGKKATYDRIVTRIISPQAAQRGNDKNGNENNPFTRSDLLLSGEQWRKNTILKMSEFGDCESRNKNVQKQSLRNLKEEINWAKHLDSIACVIVTLNSNESFNLARQLLDKFDQSGCVLAEMTIIDKSFFTQNYGRNKTVNKSQASTMVWQRWNTFRLSIDFNQHFKVALELTTTLPSECELRRWYAEPVEMIIIPSNMFELVNNNNQISLKDCYRDVCREFWNHTKANFAVRCTCDDPWIDNYPKILRNTLAPNRINGVKHDCNQFNLFGLKLPLTPDDTANKCAKYQEKKHNTYAKAIRLAIADRLQTNEKIRLMICGINGWKLLEPVMAIIDNSSAIEVFVFDEDPCNSAISINEAIEHLYADRKTKVTILADTNTVEYFHKMDIVVSITSKAIYESQCLQFNFERVREYIRPDAIFIPRQSTLSIVPITSSVAYSALLDGGLHFDYRNPTHGLQNYKIRAQTVCPLYTRNFYECAAAQELFSFKYQCSYNARSIRVMADTRTKRPEFTIDRDCVVTGFSGYFQAIMYKDVTLNNRAMFNNHNRDCVPMAYFPLKSPQSLSAQEKLKTVFWLHTDTDKEESWYEWHTTAPILTAFQNLKGDSYTLRHS